MAKPVYYSDVGRLVSLFCRLRCVGIYLDTQGGKDEDDASFSYQTGLEQSCCRNTWVRGEEQYLVDVY